MTMDYEKLADKFYSVIAHASCGSDFDNIPLAVKGCIDEVKKMNEDIVGLLSDCRNVICNSVYLDDEAHIDLMSRINAVIDEAKE